MFRFVAETWSCHQLCLGIISSTFVIITNFNNFYQDYYFKILIESLLNHDWLIWTFRKIYYGIIPFLLSTTNFSQLLTGLCNVCIGVCVGSGFDSNRFMGHLRTTFGAKILTRDLVTEAYPMESRKLQRKWNFVYAA